MDRYTQIAEAAAAVQRRHPALGTLLLASVRLARDGEMAPRELATTVVRAANHLAQDERQRPLADRLRSAVQGLLASFLDVPDYSRPAFDRRRHRTPQ